MLSGDKLKKRRQTMNMSVAQLAEAIVPANLSQDAFQKRLKLNRAAIDNWERNLMRPQPKRDDVDRLARALQVEANDLQVWKASHVYAPIAPRKARLVTNLISGRSAQDALDVLKFANKRAAVLIDKVLRSAIANADEQEADVERLYVSQARVDEGGVRQGTRRWRPKDRGRAVSWTRKASHIRVCLDLE